MWRIIKKNGLYLLILIVLLLGVGFGYQWVGSSQDDKTYHPAGKLYDVAGHNSEAALPFWSTSGKQIIVQDTSHYLHHYKPELVVKEILELAN